MSDNNNEHFDAELDELLKPLKNVEIGQASLGKWQKAMEQELPKERSVDANKKTISFKRRMIEWAVAASIGFVMAAAWMNVTHKEKEEEYFTGIDATEIHLVAKSD